MNYDYTLISTTYNTTTKAVVYTWSYMLSSGSFEKFSGTEQQLQTYLGTL